MQKILGTVSQFMPLIFGLGFVAPLVTQILERTGAAEGLPLPPLAVGLAVGGIWGAVATKTGRWL